MAGWRQEAINRIRECVQQGRVQFTHKASRELTALELDVDTELGRLPEPIELSIFRIVQDALNNVRKHAAARRVRLSLQRTASTQLLLRLEDDGQGIAEPVDLAALSATKHFGLLGISERVALLGGSMRVDSPRRGGVALNIEIPSPSPT